MTDHKHYSDYHSYMDGRIVIYKRNDHKTPRFSARFKIPNQIGGIVKSTKTADKDKAYKIAKEMYYDLEGKFQRGEVLMKLPFSKVFNDWVSLRLVEGIDKVYTFDDIRSSKKHILKFFNDRDIRKVDNFLINEFFAKRQSDTPKPSASTLKQEARRLNGILTFAYNNGLIKDIPHFPSISAKPNPRPDFTQEEYNKLVQSMGDFVDEVKANKAHGTVTSPHTIKQRGVEKKIILPGENKTNKDPKLMALVARSHRWLQNLKDGQVKNIAEIAANEIMDDGDVSRFIQYAFLAPEIVTSIFEGKQPLDLTSEKLKRLGSLPHAWSEQKSRLGY